MKMLTQSKRALGQAVKTIKSGGIVICPTDTVYGFLADAGNKKAIAKIYKIKKRAKSKPLPVFIKSVKAAKELAEISKDQEKILKKYWPGKYTFILKAKSYKLKADKTIALRIPKHKFLLSLLKKTDVSLAQTSVNISGKEPFYKISDIISQFGKVKDLLIIDAGNLKKSKPSKIIDLTKNKIKILRK